MTTARTEERRTEDGGESTEIAERTEIKGSNVKVSVHQAKCKAKAKLNKF